jgi:hypothetical protein
MSVGFLADYETANSAIKTILDEENKNGRIIPHIHRARNLANP